MFNLTVERSVFVVRYKKTVMVPIVNLLRPQGFSELCVTSDIKRSHTVLSDLDCGRGVVSGFAAVEGWCS